MPSSDRSGPPVVESKSTTEAADPLLHALQHRVRQQEILAELGVGALQGPGFDQLLADTARLTAEGLRTEFCKVLEYIPAENRLLVRAGVGWHPGVVGVVSRAVAPRTRPEPRCTATSQPTAVSSSPISERRLGSSASADDDFRDT